ncbi:hypothetical protein AA637_01060 [Cyanobacterium sp. HL-69]|uniref:hypothetical protein n=1 Tax=Cyanobacterium sp. HL-69 TaxID=2054282 RepID=UPI000CA296C2|nr:hypothetical protein AA637_01060 [Cyanobacterium sp. HL-69]
MIPSRLLQKNITLLFPLCTLLFLSIYHQKAIAQQIQVIGVSPFDETPNQSDSNPITSIPPLPDKTPPTDTIVINGNPTPARMPVPTNIKGIGSSQNLPSPPSLSEPYRAPDNSGNISPYNQTPTSTNRVTSPNNNTPRNTDSNPNNSPVTITITPNSGSNNTTTTNNSPSTSNENIPIQRRRSMREILVFDRPISPSNNSTNTTTAVNIPSNNTPVNTHSGAFRVFVRATNPNEENRVKDIYPEAFRANYQGNTVWQVGLFSTRKNAEQAAQPLRNVGLSPILSPVN